MRQRFLKPCLEQKAAIFDRTIMGQEKLRNEQIDLERQIKNQENGRNLEQEERERNEVAYS